MPGAHHHLVDAAAPGNLLQEAAPIVTEAQRTDNNAPPPEADAPVTLVLVPRDGSVNLEYTGTGNGEEENEALDHHPAAALIRQLEPEMRDEEEERYFWGPGARWSLTLSLLILLALPLLVWCCLGWRMRATTMPMEFSVDMAMTGLLLSRSSYCEAELVRNWTCRVCVESVPDFQLHRLYSNDTVNTLGLSGVLPTEKLIIVAFRGTANFDNWVHDLKFFFEPYPNPECAGCAVHLGFYQAFESVRDAVREDVAELVRRHPSHRVLVTGHSLGGAIALLSAVDMVRLPPPAGPSVSRPALGSPPHVGSGLVSPSRVALYTFGAPRLGNANFTRWAGAVLQHSYRLTHQRDLVPHLPPNSLGFVHMPQEKWFSNATDPLAVTHCNDTVEEEDATCSNSVWTPVVSDHRLYLGIPTGCRPTDADQYSF